MIERTSERIFVSYKSENANDVRELVECLLANGVDVWFAEYTVLTGNYDLVTAEFDRAIEAAIRTCSRAIVFPNREWAASGYCRREMGPISRRLSPDRILQICISGADQPESPGVASNAGRAWIGRAAEPRPTIDYGSSPFGEVLSFLASSLQKPLTLNTRRRAQAFSLGSRRAAVRGGHFAAGSFVTLPPPPQLDSIARTHFCRFVTKIDGCDVMLEVTSNPYRTALDVDDRTALALYTRKPEAMTDDRLIYSRLRERARRWYEGSEYAERGLHLYYWQGRPQLALTFVERSPDSGRPPAWCRLYSLIIPDSRTDSVGEIDFWFKVVVPLHGEVEAFATICGLFGTFDRVVSSFVYEGWD